MTRKESSAGRPGPRGIAALAALAALVSWSAAADTAFARQLTVVMISLDGTRPADVREETLPTVTRLAEQGLRAERLVPSRPTNTFPNHVTLVTGVAPERHGIVNNVFIDSKRGLFQKRDIPEWVDVEPLWSLLDRAGIPTASYHWVGSEGPWKNGRGPRHWKAFSSATPEREKVDQILAWLALEDPLERPRFITSWFHGADHAGHRQGPDTEAVAASLREQDRAIAALVEGIEESGRADSTLLLFVSDHGMRTADRTVDLGSALEAAGVEARVLGIGGFAGIHLGGGAGGDAGVAMRKLKGIGRDLGLEIFERATAPQALRVGNPRFGDAVALAPPGTAIVYPELSIVGFHGYDPNEPGMASILIASGGGLRPTPTLPPVHSIDVAPTVLALLGVAVPEWMEGTPVAALVAGVRGAESGMSGAGAALSLASLRAHADSRSAEALH